MLIIKIDINCDMGEGFGRYDTGNDKEIMKYVSSVNIACGFHAGDPTTMDKTVKEAIANKVDIGAHPGFPDLNGFGRRNMTLSHDEIRSCMIYQISSLRGFIDIYGGKLNHVKLHGALYNMASFDKEISEIVCRSILELDSQLILYALADSVLSKTGREMGLQIKDEVFADRSYESNGRLVSRNKSGAVIENPLRVCNQVLSIMRNGKVRAIDGSLIDKTGETVCVHGDNKNALLILKKLHEALSCNHIIIKGIEKEVKGT